MPEPLLVTGPASSWDARLWTLWALYTALAYTIILLLISAFVSLDLDLTHVAVDHRFGGTLLVATGGACLCGAVLGTLQWRVLRERVPMPRRQWIRACVLPSVIVWAAVVVPAAVAAENKGEDLRVAYFLAVSQALALGPLIGAGQAWALRPYTRRWRSWLVANLVSWLVVDGLFYVASLVLGVSAFALGDGSPLQAYAILLLATPISGRWLLWITAPCATSR